jgi:hypothetical protein
MNRCGLLTSLHRWASHQDENFITEALVYLLNFCLVHEPQAAAYMIEKITGNLLSLKTNEINTISVTTQVHTNKGIPDIKIESDSFLVFIEVKVDSNFASNQLSRYKVVLTKNSKQTGLITLTRYRPEQHGADITPDHAVLWHQLADWLTELPLKNSVAKFLSDEFLKLLEYRRLAMKQVSWQLEEGVIAFRNLIDMLGEALSSRGINIHSRSAAWDWIGYYLENKRLFAGITYENPGIVIINNEGELVDNKPDEPEIGFYQSENEWRNELDLYSEDVHFFCRTKASQIACLGNFVEESVKYGLSLTKCST